MAVATAAVSADLISGLLMGLGTNLAFTKGNEKKSHKESSSSSGGDINRRTKDIPTFNKQSKLLPNILQIISRGKEHLQQADIPFKDIAVMLGKSAAGMGIDDFLENSETTEKEGSGVEPFNREEALLIASIYRRDY